MQDILIKPGRYVVAVSGGIDSMVLLDILSKTPEVGIAVAHFDHGIREDSTLDRQLVQQVSAHYGLPFVFDEGHLGSDASEATARKARYEFLHKVRVAAHADALITAHHQDDMLETAIINILRGTGRKGLSSLQSKDRLIRPLLHITKTEIRNYAHEHHITWREDSTNQDEKYLRNYVRKRIINALDDSHRAQLLRHIDDVKRLNDDIDQALANQLHIQPAVHKLDRHWFIDLPHAVAKEVMAAWLRERGIQQFDRKTLERLIVAGKTFETGKQTDITNKQVLVVKKDYLALKRLDR